MEGICSAIVESKCLTSRGIGHAAWGAGLGGCRLSTEGIGAVSFPGILKCCMYNSEALRNLLSLVYVPQCVIVVVKCSWCYMVCSRGLELSRNNGREACSTHVCCGNGHPLLVVDSVIG